MQAETDLSSPGTKGGGPWAGLGGECGPGGPRLQPPTPRPPTKGKGLSGVSVGGDSFAVWLDPSEGESHVQRLEDRVTSWAFTLQGRGGLRRAGSTLVRSPSPKGRERTQKALRGQPARGHGSC